MHLSFQSQMGHMLTNQTEYIIPLVSTYQSSQQLLVENIITKTCTC